MTAATSTLITEPGVWANMSDDVYHADPVPGGSLSSGGARRLLEPGGPRKFAYDRAHPRTGGTKTFDLGHAVHTMALGAGPALWIVDAPDWRTKAAREERDEAYAAGKVPILVEDASRVRHMVDAILDTHPIAEALLRADGAVEQSLFWVDQATGVWCRARHDKATRDRNGRLVIVDVKTCENAHENAFRKSLATYGYHQQDPWYRDAAIALGLDDDPAFLFIAVEKQPPHLVNVLQLADEDLEVGRRRNRAALRTYAECTETGVWPGYGTDIATVTLPPYYPTQEY